MPALLGIPPHKLLFNKGMALKMVIFWGNVEVGGKATARAPQLRKGLSCS